MESESIGIGGYPLLVKVQTIDIHKLDVKTIAAFKPKNVTCVEASNLLIFVGVTSGTVYVFSRETRAYKYMIPFTGGKVCCISCSENEKEVAIGSIRGVVSIYELVKDRASNVKTTRQTQANSTATSPPAFFKYIATVEHHKGNEITELLWSPNGKYLFAGDTQGVVSQTDVGSYSDYPRPMSEVILKLKSRVIQIQFLFPFLAICTVSAVFIGDIENEDFARIHFGSKEEIQATGLALVLNEVSPHQSHATVYLYVSEMKTGMLHRFNLQGQLQESIVIDCTSQTPIVSFDPLVTEDILSTTNKSKEVNTTVCLGKLLLSDENLLLSISQNSFYVIDPTRMKLIYWNDEFRKIQNSKLQSNYVFLWSSAKVVVLSLTSIFPYAEQLFHAGTSVPFQRWIHHCLVSIGWKSVEDEDSEYNRKVIDDFCTVFQLRGNGSNTIDFRKSISLQIPFAIPEEPIEQEMETDNEEIPCDPLVNLVQKLLEAFDDYEAGRGRKFQENGNDEPLANIWISIEAFYSSIIDNISLEMKEPLTILNIFTHIENCWITDSVVVNLYDTLVSIPTDDVQLLNERILHFLQSEFIHSGYTSSQSADTDANIPLPPIHFFSSFVRQDVVADWFQNLGISKDQLFEDSLFADLLLLLVPFLSPESQSTVGTDLGSGQNLGFSTWLLLSTFYNFGQVQNPYEMQLKSLFSSKSHSLDKGTPSYPFVKTIFNSIYGDLVQSNLRPLQSSLHHLMSLLYFITDTDDVIRQEGVSKKDEILSLLISSFPLKHWSRDKIFPKLTSLCRSNPTLLRMYEEACLFSEQSTQLCQCGIPLKSCPENSAFKSGGPPTGISNFVSTVKEVVIDLRSVNLRNSIRSNIERGVSPLTNSDQFPFKLTMNRKLFEPFWTSHAHLLDEGTLMELILRTASCALLRAFPITESRISALLKRRVTVIQDKTCEKCGDKLEVSEGFTSISTDCIGVSIFNNHCFQSIDKFRAIVEDIPVLNSPGMFSLRFYQEIGSSLAKGHGGGRRDIIIGQTNGFGPPDVSCNCFHI